MKPIILFVLISVLVVAGAVYFFMFSAPVSPASQKNTSINISGNSSIICTANYSPVCGMDNKTYSNKCNAESFGVNISYIGACVGTSSNNCFLAPDVCANSTHLLKFNCQNNSQSNATVPCPSGSSCSNGSCKLNPNTFQSQCNDSDNGLDYLVFGKVTSNGKIYNDTCTILTQVQEFYCQNNSVASTDIMCPLTHYCQNGSCIQKPISCEDSDGGKETKLVGSITITEGFTKYPRGTDYCFNETDVIEYFCFNNSIEEEILSCGSDYYCTDGKCAYAKCKDSDNGQDLLMLGTTTRGHEKYTDSCSGSLNVKEYFCDSNELKYTINTCPSSYVCDSGQCIKP